MEKQIQFGIQVGTFAGQSAQIFLSSNAFKKFYCIDPWIQGFDPNDCITSNDLPDAQKQFDQRFKDNVIVQKIKLNSLEALSKFQDQSIDFIYIDGNHQYEFVKQDLQNYYKKLKVNGIIAGHDYSLTGFPIHIRGVKKAIDQFFKKQPLKIYEDTSWVYIKEK